MHSLHGEDSGKIITLTTIADFVKKNQIDRIDYLKIDVEGHEKRGKRGK
jgi:FkbM family methyltransferase